MAGIDKVWSARYDYRVNQLLEMGFYPTGSMYTKDVFAITTVEIGHSSVDEWNQKIQNIKDGKRFSA